MDDETVMQYIEQSESHQNKSISDDKENYILGIDLGTTNSCIGLWRNNNIEIISDEYGNKTIPSFVSFSSVSKYVGNDAKNQKDLNAENVFYEVKRLIGREFNENCVTELEKLLSYKIIENDRGGISIQSTIKNNKTFTPEEISAQILLKLKSMASSYLKREIKNVVVTVPAHFSDSQRQATKDAATIAGLNCVRIIHEPTAAALAYGIMERSAKKADTEMTIMVYDFGGGTLDCSLMTVFNGIFDVIGSSGISYFGGIDFDNRLIIYCLAVFSRQHLKTSDLKACNVSRLSLQKLRTQCEAAKKILSTNTTAYIGVENFYDDKNLFVKITRQQFEDLCRDLFLLCIKCIDDILTECNMTHSDVDEVILVGGMTRMPYIREILTNRFRTSDGKNKINCSINPDEVVAMGAAIQGFIIGNRDDAFSDSVTLLDATPLSLGVEVMGGCMDILIKRNTHIPYEVAQLYSTDTDYVDSVTIKIFEGERSLTKHNIKVGEFVLNNIPKYPKGMPEIEITFSIDNNGIVTVSAIEKENQEKSTIIVNTNKNGLKPEQIRKLIEEAEEQEHTDELDRAKKITYYNIEDTCGNILKNISSKDVKLTERDIKAVNDDVAGVLGWLKSKLYSQRDLDEYEKTLEKIKTKYGTLILGGKTTTATAYTSEMNATTVHGDEEEEDEMKQAFEKINSPQINGLTEAEQTELKELRHSIGSLCDNIIHIIHSNTFNIPETEKNEFLQQIDDVMLWFHSHENPTKTDYREKIDYINSLCDSMVEQYENSEHNIFDKKTDTKQELEELCLTLTLLLKNKQLPDCPETEELSSLARDALKYVYIDNLCESTARDYISQINNICDKISNSNKSHLEKNPIIESTNEGQNDGTNVMNILIMKQNEEIETMINEQL